MGMKGQNDKLIDIIIEQAVQLEISRLKNKELSILVERLSEQLLKFDPTCSILPKILNDTQGKDYSITPH